MHRVTIQSTASSLSCKSKTTVLDSALAAGIAYPHDCRSGECGRCKTRLIQGEVSHDPYDPAALSTLERDTGLFLACRCRPRSDLIVDWLEHDIQEIDTTVQGINRVAHDVIQLQLHVPDLQFAAGQYCYLEFANDARRAYSMANVPGDSTCEFHIRMVPGGSASTYVRDSLQVGDAVKVNGPFGGASLRKNSTGNIIAIAGGTGLAPIFSIVRTALLERPHCNIQLFFGAREHIDLYPPEALAALETQGVSVRVALSEATDTTYSQGLIHEIVRAELGSADINTDTVAYVAGPAPMVKSVFDVLFTEKGMPEQNILRDAFTATGGEQPLKSEANVTQSVWRRLLFGRLARSGAA